MKNLVCGKAVSTIPDTTCGEKYFLKGQLIYGRIGALFALLVAGIMSFNCFPLFRGFQRNIYENNFTSEKDNRHIINVQAISQFPELPSGCEPTAASMLLNWAGVDVSKQDIAKAMPKAPLPVLKNGIMIGDNPDVSFVGDPFSYSGLGAYHEVIANMINKYLPGRADDVSGVSFESILNIIDSGRPVMVWSTLSLLEPKESIAWNDKSGGIVDWKSPEHVYLMVGHEGNTVYVDDPYTGEIKSFPMPLFRMRWEQMGRQAVTVSMEGQPDFRSGQSSVKSIPGTDTSNCSKPAARGINVTDKIKNIVQKAARFKNLMCISYMEVKNISISSKLSNAADFLYEGIIFIADNM